MFALRRYATPLRTQSYNVGIFRKFFAGFSLPDYELGIVADAKRGHDCVTFGKTFLSKFSSCGFSCCSKCILGYRSLSSQSGSRSSGSGSNHDDGCFEHGEGSARADDVWIDGPSFSGIHKDAETKLPEKNSGRILFDAISKNPPEAVGYALSKYAKEGHSSERDIIYTTMLGLRRRHMFAKALQDALSGSTKLSEWTESSNCFDFLERDFVIRLDLIAKVHGLLAAERYIEKIPESFRNEVIYRTLLANYVYANNIQKSENVFNKIRDLGFPLTEFTCNQLLILYKRIDRMKMANVLAMMEKENIKPSRITYEILINAKGCMNDIKGIEQIIETMKSQGTNPNEEILAKIARYYIFGGFRDKAEAVLKEIEGDDINVKRWAARLILPLYAALGKEDDVERIWNVCKVKTREEEFLAAIEAWGKLGRVDKAENVFADLSKTWNSIPPRFYIALLKVYANHKLLAKGKELAKEMSINWPKLGRATWDALVNLYIKAGEVEKAYSVLQRAIERYQLRPFYGTYAVLLENYAKRGDIHNAEKVFDELQKGRYTGRINTYQLLLEAYINAKVPAYGFMDRMKADNLLPDGKLARQLKVIESFKRRQI